MKTTINVLIKLFIIIVILFLVNPVHAGEKTDKYKTYVKTIYTEGINQFYVCNEIDNMDVVSVSTGEPWTYGEVTQYDPILSVSAVCDFSGFDEEPIVKTSILGYDNGDAFGRVINADGSPIQYTHASVKCVFRADTARATPQIVYLTCLEY